MANREHVLILDDDPSLRSMLEQALLKDGFVTRSFGEAKEALRSIDDAEPIAILLDIHLPDMDGVEFLHHLRRLHPDVPVVVITGSPDQEIFRRTLPYQIADFLVKPFGIEKIQESIRKSLGRDESFVESFLETTTARIREARRNLGLTQAQVAARCGLSSSQVSQIELRQSIPSIPALLKLCKALNLSVTELVKGF